jgi:Lar family restriction alleviation protein
MKKNDKKLKPCPFCGEEANDGYRNPALGCWYVSCPACHAVGPLESTKEEATASWNRRAKE